MERLRKLQVALQIGTFGWQYDDWQGVFYPEDLPEAWQLDYFSNLYRVVLVPEKTWQSWSPQALQDIVESVGDGFTLYLALQNNLNGGVTCVQIVERLTEILSALGDVVQGFVIWSETPFTQSTFLQRPVTLVSSQYCLPGWQWRPEALWLSGNPLGFVTELSHDGKAQAALLTTFVESLPDVEHEHEKKAPFIIGGGKISAQHVANLKTIGELLGY